MIKKAFTIIIATLAIILGSIFVAGLIFIDPPDEHLFELCKETKLGATLSDLEKLFGKANEVQKLKLENSTQFLIWFP